MDGHRLAARLRAEALKRVQRRFDEDWARGQRPDDEKDPAPPTGRATARDDPPS